MKTKNPIRGAFVALSALAAALIPLSAAEVSPTDPVPNTAGPPPEGGIGYRWTVRMGAQGRGEIDGQVGSWSWDEDAQPETARGWTHHSAWVALELLEDARLTIRIAPKAGMTAPVSALNPDGIAFTDLVPSFTIYAGWQDEGPNPHTYNNRGDIEWATQTRYVTHFEQTSSNVIEGTMRLKAGRYTIAIGGNSPVTEREGRQGYGAVFTTRPYFDPVGVTMTRERLSTRAPRLLVGGGLTTPEAVESVELRFRGRTIRARVRGNRWSAAVNGLRHGRNPVSVRAISKDGSSSRPIPFAIERIATSPRPTPNPLHWTLFGKLSDNSALLRQGTAPFGFR
jgi:hypothetical protein